MAAIARKQSTAGLDRFEQVKRANRAARSECLRAVAAFPELYRLGRVRGRPMTHLVAEAIERYLASERPVSDDGLVKSARTLTGGARGLPGSLLDVKTVTLDLSASFVEQCQSHLNL